MSELTVQTEEATTPLCECGCGEHVTPGLVFGKPRRYIRGHGPQATGKTGGGARRKPTGRTPSLDELKATKPERDEDKAPGTANAKTKRRRARAAATDEVPYKAGVIARGMNKLYARTGKFVKVMDADIGSAIIAASKESDDDVTVGEAWDELAKTNPRIRAVLLKMITGGAWTQVFMAHAPILLAVLMKDAVRKRLPFPKLTEFVTAFGNDDETGDTGEAGGGGLGAMLANLTPEDLAQVSAMMDGGGPLINMVMGQMRNPTGTGRVPATVGVEHVHVAGDPPCAGCGWSGEG